MENALPGDPGWALGTGDKRAVVGYGDQITLHAGDTLNVAVSTQSARPVTWTVYRMGWYGGAGGRLVGSGGPINGTPQAMCPRDPVTSRIECSWPMSFDVPIAADALSGIYLVKLHTSIGESYVPFVVVDGRPADMVLNVNVTSWQAYNEYGGESLYADASGTMPGGRAYEVSYDRPFDNDGGAGRFFDWESSFVPFVEALGYDVTYTTAFDLAANPDSLASAHVFVSLANDEYWLPAERDAVQSARDAGVNLAFLGADQVLWRIRSAPSRDGRPKRVIVEYKDLQGNDPDLATLGDAGSTAEFRNPPNESPENGLIGAMYEGWMTLAQPLVISAPDHWLFAGTGLAAGDTLPGLVSAEFDTRYDNGVEPAGLVELGRSHIVSAQGWPDVSTMTTYTAASGAVVVSAGTIGWANGLGKTPYANPAVAKITRNLLDRFTRTLGGPDPDGAPWTQPGSPSQVDGHWAAEVSTILTGLAAPGGAVVAADGTVFVADTLGHVIWRIGPGGDSAIYAGGGIGGTANGPGNEARFRYPAGLALGADGTLYVADSFNDEIRAVAPDAAHTVSTFAGVADPSGGLVDGPGAQARFRRPIGVAIASDGSLLVADMQNSRIRRVAFDGPRTVTTYAGSSAGFSDGPAATAQMNSPSALAVGADGTVYFVDTYQHALRAVGADPAHTITTLAGGYDQGVGVDGPAASAHLSPQGGIVAVGGTIVFSDTANQVIRAFDLASATVYTVAGSGRSALADGGGSAASFVTPLGLAVGPDGSVVVADSGDGAVRRIRF